MTAQNDLDRALGAWFGAEATPAPAPELLARILETTHARRPRPFLMAGIGSHWVTEGSTNGARGGAARLRPALVIALVALLVLALVGGAMFVGSRLLTPPVPVGHVYRNELVGAPNLPTPLARPVLMPLLDGRALAIGNDGGTSATTAYIFEPATGAVLPEGPMTSAGPVSSAVRLRDGRVLIIGEVSAGIFDPATLMLTHVGPMVAARSGANVALLSDGRVLIAGGTPPGGNPGIDPALKSAELFDPDTLTFSPTGPIGTPTGGGSMLPESAQHRVGRT